MKVAVTGASGFIGNRVVEKFYLGRLHDVVPLVRHNSSLTLPARFELPWAACDHFSVEALARAFEGCEAVIHAAFGTPLGKMSRAVYLAAEAAGVGRVVVLSSASVYNQNPAPGTTEESPLPERPATPYNANKIAADDVFRRLRAKGRAELVFLMPGVVYGPRSQWIARLAEQAAEGTAYLINEGRGICNAVYVDNLVEAARLALGAGGADGESFFVSDAETVTWADFYRPALAALGKGLDDVRRIEPQVFDVSLREKIRGRLLDAAETPTVQRLKPRVPPALKKIYKGVMSLSAGERPPADGGWLLPDERPPEVALDMNVLQQCVYKLPNTKAERLLGYRPVMTFEAGMRRSVDWLKFAGYPVTS
jgi:nucleoside-diphosphate-sugar epimerase